MIILIDNYDSFVYNIFQYLGILNYPTKVFRNDQITLAEIEKLNPDCIFLSPGPGYPKSAGICLEAISKLGDKYPIFGVCLGHQSIAEAFGGNIIKAPSLMHGKVSNILHNKDGIFEDIPSPLTVTRYHSLIVEKETLPDCLEVTCETEDKIIMGIRHKTLPIEGIQFHPESYMTHDGLKILNNFLKHHAKRIAV